MKPLEPPDSCLLSDAVGWLGLGNWQEANATLEKIAPQLRSHPAVLEVRWEIYSIAQQWEVTIDIARAITKLAPDSPLGWIKLAFSLRAVKRTQQAYDTLKPILDRFPNEWVMRYNMACFSCQLGNLEEARQWLKLAYARGKAKEVKLLVIDDPDLEPLWADIQKT